MVTTRPFSFTVQGERCSAYLHTPIGEGRWPGLLMGHGFATEWTFGTEGFIRAFTQAGWAVMTFDYRRYGESEGEPRQLLQVFDQLQDWQGALAALKEQAEVDEDRIALWGSSLGGGHALTTAAGRNDLLGVIAQVPHTGAAEGGVNMSVWQIVQLIAHGFYDVLRSKLGLSAHRVPIFSDDGFSVLPYAGWQQAYLNIVTPGTKWEPQLPARSMLNVGDYKPVDSAHDIHCPTLLLAGSRDEGCTAEDIRKTASLIPDCRLEVLDCDHFDVYSGPFHEQALALQCAFLAEINQSLDQKAVHSAA